MGKAWIDGASVPSSEAVSAAARLLGDSRLPLVTGLGTDVAGVKAALKLARICGGAVDHGGSEVLYRNIEALRGGGMFLAAPAEMRRRADRFLLVGPDVAELAPDLLAFLFGGTRDLGRPSPDGGPRRIIWLGAPAGATLPANQIMVESVACEPEGLCDALAMIRAALGGRRFDDGPISAATAAGIAETLGKASFACVVWSAVSLDAIGVEMASGLVADVNVGTRASSLPLSGGGHAWGAAQIATSVSGFPLRVSFGRGAPEHDAWAFDARRLVASGECDLVVDVSALGEGGKGGRGAETGGIPLISIGHGHGPADGAKVAFEVGMPGRDHAGVLYTDLAGSFVPVGATAAGGETATAAEVLAAIAAALEPSSAKRAA